MTPSSTPGLDALVANHRRFLAFLERRTGSRADAEDILQSAFVRVLEKGGALRDAESSVAWFYRLLRNALVDYYRAGGAAERATAALAREAGEPGDAEDAQLKAEVCRCIGDLLPALKPDYAALIRAVDLEGASVKDASAAAGISPNNGAVRLHRARQALLKEVQRSCRTCAAHGCLDCTCGGV